MSLQDRKNKGVEFKDLTVGTGDEATTNDVVAVNVREFLRRGDEVSPSPLFGVRRIIDLGRRECIAGLRYGIPGMRVGGTREIIISPHLAYGEQGIPGKIPSNALLRCLVELLEIREHSGILPQDWLPGKTLIICSRDSHADQPGWQFSMHEEGTAWFSFRQPNPDNQQKQAVWRQIPIQLEAAKSKDLIRDAMNLPKRIPEDCVDWNSGLIDKEHSIVVQLIESGATVLMMGLRERSSAFRDSVLLSTVKELTAQYFLADPASS